MHSLRQTIHPGTQPRSGGAFLFVSGPTSTNGRMRPIKMQLRSVVDIYAREDF
jgi:hypothetical protein